MNILEQLVGKDYFSDFLKHHLGKTPFARPFVAKHFENIVSWQDLDGMLAMHEDSWLPARGKLPEDSSLNQGKLTIQQAKKHFDSGRTILLRHAEKSHLGIGEIAASFQGLFKAPVDVQLYVTPRASEGFDWHYDVEDVFVIQTTGEKEFRLLQNTVSPRPLPLRADQRAYLEKEKMTPEICCTLKAGDCLYIPAGFWHKARATSDSFHLSVGILLQ